MKRWLGWLMVLFVPMWKKRLCRKIRYERPAASARVSSRSPENHSKSRWSGGRRAKWVSRCFCSAGRSAWHRTTPFGMGGRNTPCVEAATPCT